jgi:hypothetical protein
MTDEQKAAYIYAQAVCAMAEIEAMKAENAFRQMRGESMAYNDESFLAVPEKYALHHNAVVSLFGG